MASVKEVLTKVDGVSEVTTDIPTKEARVTFDPAKTEPAKLAKLLTDHEGQHDFTASVKEESPASS